MTDNSLEIAKLDLKVYRATETLRYAHRKFGGDSIYMLSSFGVNSALMFQLVKESGVKIPVLTIDTGFWYSETHQFKDRLIREYGMKLTTASPSKEEVDEVLESHLWLSNLDQYHEVVKLEPLRKKIIEKNITALVSAIRRGQTANRQHLQALERGRYGELRVHPVIDWTKEDLELFFETRQLPKHPLSHLYASIGDWTTTRPGDSRSESRNLENGECGIHISKNGEVTTNGAKDKEEDNDK